VNSGRRRASIARTKWVWSSANLELQRRELGGIREAASQERDACRNAVEQAHRVLESEGSALRREAELLRREFSILREEVALQRGLRDLRDEVEEACEQVPKIPAIADRLTAEQKHLEAEQARLERELAKTKDRVGKLRVDQSVTDFSLKKLEEAQQPVVELKFVTEDGCCFSLKDAHPDAIETWRKFAHELVAANDGVMFPNDPSNVISMPVPRRSSDAA
jgi:hypothetical protein